MAKKIRFKKLRLWMVYPVFIIYPFVARMSAGTVLAGSLIFIVGQATRLWASGYLIKSHHLTTCGPYAYTRNPLYMGNLFLGLGVVVMSGNIPLILYYAASFYFLYAGTVKAEEKDLRKKFGKDFDDYAVAVPPFVPTPFAYSRREKRSFSWSHVFRNGEFIRLSGFGVLLAFLHLWYLAMADISWRRPRGIVTLVLFVSFSALIWLNIVMRRKREKSGGTSKERLRAVLSGTEPK